MEENQESSPDLNKNRLPAIIKGKLALDLTKAHGNYLQLIKSVLEADVTEDNFQQNQNVIKTVNSILNYVENHRKNEKNPYLEAGKEIDTAHKAFSKPIEDARDSLQQKLNIIGKKMEEAENKRRQEIERQSSITSAINQFVLDSSIRIASANSNEQLLQIERLVNLEKANKSKYQEFLPSLIERCNDLTANIKDQKELIKQKEVVLKQQKDAIESGNDEKAKELLDKMELLDEKMEENTLLVQETASKSILTSDIIIPESNEAKARSARWNIEISDPKEAMKKAPDLLKVELDFQKASEVLKTLRETGVLSGKDSYTLNGIRYYQNKKW